MNAVIFDMDGVLIDSERVVLEAFRYAGEKTGVPNAERMAIIGLGLNDNAWMARFMQEFGAEADAVLKYSEEYMAHFYATSAAPAKRARWSCCGRSGTGMCRRQSHPPRHGPPW